MAKKLAVFCDGTWSDLRLPHLTNVARLAKCVADKDSFGIPQIVYYDEGVGVSDNISPTVDWLVRKLGGAFGLGLDRKIEAAYRFLVLNYEPDDEIYIFGFSRGAYTARSLCGLIRKCGIVRRDSFDRVPDALELYRDGQHPMEAAVVSFRQQYAHVRTAGPEDHTWVNIHPEAGDDQTKHERHPRARLYQYRTALSYQMMYLGVWDTVGSLGVPSKFTPLLFLNKRYSFHDTKASSLLSSVRHAVALEEDRRVFDVAPIENIFDLNVQWATSDRVNWNVGTPSDPRFVPYNHRPYQQVWFAGGHSAVGGGWPDVGLSSAALLWIAEGAHDAGLAFRDARDNELWSAWNSINPMADARFNKDGSPMSQDKKDALGEVGGYSMRKGPQSLHEVSQWAKIRWCADQKWRPTNLKVLQMSNCPPVAPPVAPVGFPQSPVGFPPI